MNTMLNEIKTIIDKHNDLLIQNIIEEVIKHKDMSNVDILKKVNILVCQSKECWGENDIQNSYYPPINVEKRDQSEQVAESSKQVLKEESTNKQPKSMNSTSNKPKRPYNRKQKTPAPSSEPALSSTSEPALASTSEPAPTSTSTSKPAPVSTSKPTPGNVSQEQKKSNIQYDIKKNNDIKTVGEISNVNEKPKRP